MFNQKKYGRRDHTISMVQIFTLKWWAQEPMKFKILEV